MAESQEPKSERISFALTATELEALEFVKKIHSGRYDGTSSVLRDYSVTDCVRLHQTAKVEAAA